MTNELEILKSVDEKNNITQRELARRTGLSLGSVNVLLKKLIHKGLLKIEHVNSRTIRYMLTPKGLMEKVRLTYQYIVISYNRILSIERKIEQVTEDFKGCQIVLLGEKDELFEIISGKLKSMNIHFIFTNDNKNLLQYNDEEYIILTWSPDHLDKEFSNYNNIINVLS
ncbi:MAG: winged helix-turn-helix transcriptional regulator [Clostridiaceae bacterium]|jgi:DNA-binding MarR family transcriptional regulator|nr:winged helix-turn-helix transcriptional regulator [Clostridiaceae bacterium]